MVKTTVLLRDDVYDFLVNNKKLTILGTKVPSISREFFGIENCRTKVRGIKPTIFNKFGKRECQKQ